MNKIVLTESLDFEKDINTYNSWIAAKKTLDDLKIKDKQQFESLKNILNKEKSLKYLDKFDNSTNLKKAFNVIFYNASLKNKIAKNPSGIEEKNIPTKARTIAKEFGFNIPAGSDNSQYKEEYTKLLSQRTIKQQEAKEQTEKQFQEPQQKQQEKIKKQAKQTIKKPAKNEENYEDDDDNYDYSYESEENEDKPSKARTTSNREYNNYYIAKSPKEIAQKITLLITPEIKNTQQEIEALNKNHKISPAEKARKTQLLLSKKTDLNKILQYYKDIALKQEKGFSVYPTEHSKIKALTKAQIQYDKAKANLDKINNQYASKAIGSYAAIGLRSAAAKAKDTYEKLNKKLNEPDEASDITKRAVNIAGSTIKRVKNNINDKMKAMAEKAEQQGQANQQQAQAQEKAKASQQQTQPKAKVNKPKVQPQQTAQEQPVAQPQPQVQPQPQPIAQPQPTVQPQAPQQPQPKASWFSKIKNRIK